VKGQGETAHALAAPDTEIEADEEETEGPGQAGAAGRVAQLDREAVRGYKEGLIGLLHPGECVFQALRRLGGLHVRPGLRLHDAECAAISQVLYLPACLSICLL
jgi:hypothetical protein